MATTTMGNSKQSSVGNVPKVTQKNPHAVALGRKGGKARIHKLTAEQRREIAVKAARARWAKAEKKNEQSQ